MTVTIDGVKLKAEGVLRVARRGANGRFEKAVLDKKLAGVSYLNMPPLEPYRSKLYVAGLLADKSGVVMILRKGQGELKGGGRGRTFRRKPKRRNKNGGRSTRKSQRHRHK